jgi:hypothetical protein
MDLEQLESYYLAGLPGSDHRLDPSAEAVLRRLDDRTDTELREILDLVRIAAERDRTHEEQRRWAELTFRPAPPTSEEIDAALDRMHEVDDAEA